MPPPRFAERRRDRRNALSPLLGILITLFPVPVPLPVRVEPVSLGVSLLRGPDERVLLVPQQLAATETCVHALRPGEAAFSLDKGVFIARAWGSNGARHRRTL